jgi:hemerythrin-like domain-containing protein
MPQGACRECGAATEAATAMKINPADKNCTGNIRATDVLREEHEQINALFDQFMLALNDESDTRLSIGHEICERIGSYAAMEQEMFYPAIRLETGKLVADSLRDHEDIAECLEVYRDLDAQDAERDTVMLRAMELVGQHLAEEEEILFPLVEQSLPDVLYDICPSLLEYREDYEASIDTMGNRA